MVTVILAVLGAAVSVGMTMYQIKSNEATEARTEQSLERIMTMERQQTAHQRDILYHAQVASRKQASVAVVRPAAASVRPAAPAPRPTVWSKQAAARASRATAATAASARTPVATKAAAPVPTVRAGSASRLPAVPTKSVARKAPAAVPAGKTNSASVPKGQRPARDDGFRVVTID